MIFEAIPHEWFWLSKRTFYKKKKTSYCPFEIHSEVVFKKIVILVVIFTSLSKFVPINIVGGVLFFLEKVCFDGQTSVWDCPGNCVQKIIVPILVLTGLPKFVPIKNAQRSSFSKRSRFEGKTAHLRSS